MFLGAQKLFVPEENPIRQMLSSIRKELYLHALEAQKAEGVNVEIEARLTNYLMRQGDTGLYKDTFNNLRERADKRYLHKELTETSEFVINGRGRRKIVRKGDKAFLAAKNNFATLALPEYRLKVSIELEEPEAPLNNEELQELLQVGIKYARKKERYSYSISSNCRLDMTISTEGTNSHRKVVYSVEVELLDPRELEEFEYQLTEVYKMTYGTHWVYQENFLKTILSNVNKKLNGGPGNGIDPSVVAKTRNLKIEDLGTGMTEYVVSTKAEGDRSFLVLTETVLSIVSPRYSLDVLLELSTSDIVDLIASMSTKDTNGTKSSSCSLCNDGTKRKRVSTINHESIIAVFDGEVVPTGTDTYFMITDLVYIKGTIIPREHALRMTMAQSIKEMIDIPEALRISLRTVSTYIIKTPEQFFSTCTELLSRQYDYPTHGLLFRPMTYYPEELLGKNTLRIPLAERNLSNTKELIRWKNEDKLTIDLKYIKGKGLFSYTESEGLSEDIEFKGSESHPFNLAHSVDIDLLSNYNSGTIIEFVRSTKVITIAPQANVSSLPHPYSVTKDSEGLKLTIVTLVPVRTRVDKVKPNRLDYAIDNWNLMFDFLSREDLEGKSDKFLIRAYAQLTKYTNEEVAREGTLLNINVGKVSEITTWNRYNKIITVEHSPEYARELKRLLALKGLMNKVKVFQNSFDSKVVGEIKSELRNTYPSVINVNGDINVLLSIPTFLSNLAKLMGENTVLKFIGLDGTALQELPLSHEAIVTEDGQMVKTGRYTLSVGSDRLLVTNGNEYELAKVSRGKVLYVNDILSALDLVEIKRGVGMREEFMTAPDKIVSSLFSWAMLRKRKEDEEYIFLEEELKEPEWIVRDDCTGDIFVTEERMEPIEFSSSTSSSSLVDRRDLSKPYLEKIKTVLSTKLNPQRSLSPSAQRGLSSTSPRKPLRMCPREELKTSLPVGDFRPIVIEGINGNFVRIGVMADGNCLIHAIMTAASKSYNNLNRADKAKAASAVRAELAEGAKYMVTEDGKSIVALLPYDTMINAPDSGDVELRLGLLEESVQPMGYENILAKVATSGIWLGTEISAVLPEALGINIVNFDMVGNKARKVSTYMATTPSKFYVAILNIGGHYEVIAQIKDTAIITIFGEGDVLVR